MRAVCCVCSAALNEGCLKHCWQTLTSRHTHTFLKHTHKSVSRLSFHAKVTPPHKHTRTGPDALLAIPQRPLGLPVKLHARPQSLPTTQANDAQQTPDIIDIPPGSSQTRTIQDAQRTTIMHTQGQHFLPRPALLSTPTIYVHAAPDTPLHRPPTTDRKP